MKRAMLAFLLLLVALPSAAVTRKTVAVIAREKMAYTTVYVQGMNDLGYIGSLNDRRVVALLDRLGAKYDIIKAKNVKTEQARQGAVAAAAGYVRQYDGVITLGYMMGGTRDVYGSTASYRPDSLSKCAKGGWRVPALLIMDTTLHRAFSAQSVCDSTGGIGSTPANIDTSGTWVDTSGGSGAGKLGASVDQLTYSTLNPANAWVTAPYNNGWHRNPTPPIGGLRMLLGKCTGGNTFHQTNARWSNGNIDSLLSVGSESSDSMVVWDRLWSFPVAAAAVHADLPTAKTVTYCDWMGNGGGQDSLGSLVPTAPEPPQEGTIPTLLFALAHYDSLLGGGLITKPIQIAFVVEGGLSRGLRRWIRGIAPGDTAAYYSTLDSLAMDQIPVTFAVNPESAAAYPRDVQKLLTNRAARFTPQVWDGIDGAAGNPGISAAMHARDVFGRKSPRAIAGDSSFTRWTQRGSGGDSSLVMMLRYAQARQDSAFGADRACRFLVAPDDDWSPIGATQSKIDSLLWAITRLGYKGIVSDGQKDAANIYGAGPRATADTIGWYNRQGYYPVRDAATGSITGSTSILCHQGFTMYQGVRQFWGTSDSTGSTTGYNQEYATDVARAWMAVAGAERAMDRDVFQSEDPDGDAHRYTYRDVRIRTEDMLVNWPTKGYVVRLNASGLSGDPAQPARCGLWIMRSIWKSAQEINRAAGKTVVQITYPDRIDPR